MRIVLALFILSCFGYTQNNVYYYRDHRIGLAVEPGTPPVQGDYYVDAVSGNDANDGLTTGTAWKTLDKVSGESFVPGDTILFNRGDTFQGTLTISSSGSSGSPIVYGAYGTGLKPILTLRDSISGWSNGDNWTNDYGNFWYIDLATAYPVERMWFDGVEANFVQSSDDMDADSLFSHWWAADLMYVYSVGNPAGVYSSMEYAGDEYHVIRMTDVDYVKLDGLDIQGGMYSSIGAAGADYITISNCNIGKYSNREGIYAQSQYLSSTDQTCDYWVVANDTIDSDWSYGYMFYTANTPCGITVNSATDWDIYNNYIKNWWQSILVLGADGASTYHDIYNNELTSPNFSLSYPAIFSSSSGWASGSYQWVDFYNNYCHDFTNGIEVASSGNKIYYNIISNLVASTNVHGIPASNSWGMQLLIGVLTNDSPESTYVFNNTFYDIPGEMVDSYGTDENWFKNNLIVDVGTYTGLAVQDDFTNHSSYVNNLFYETGADETDTFVYLISGAPTYTVTTFNALGGTISGNLQHIGDVADLVNVTTFALPSGSTALNAGVDIDALLPDGFTDRESNVVNQAAPNIGAIDNTP